MKDAKFCLSFEHGRVYTPDPTTKEPGISLRFDLEYDGLHYFPPIDCNGPGYKQKRVRLQVLPLVDGAKVLKATPKASTDHLSLPN